MSQTGSASEPAAVASMGLGTGRADAVSVKVRDDSGPAATEGKLICPANHRMLLRPLARAAPGRAAPSLRFVDRDPVLYRSGRVLCRLY